MSLLNYKGSDEMKFNTPILQVVGFQNSGKTKLVSKILGCFKKTIVGLGHLNIMDMMGIH